MTVDVHSRAEQAVHLVRGYLKPRKREQLVYQLLIESRCYHRAVRQAERFCAAVKTHSGRTVRCAAARYAEVYKAFRYTRKRRCRAGSYLRAAHTLSAYYAGKVIVGKLRDKLIKRILAALYVGKLYSLVAGLRYLCGKILSYQLIRVKLAERNGFCTLFISVTVRYRENAVKRSMRREHLLTVLVHRR